MNPGESGPLDADETEKIQQSIDGLNSAGGISSASSAGKKPPKQKAPLTPAEQLKADTLTAIKKDF